MSFLFMIILLYEKKDVSLMLISFKVYENMNKLYHMCPSLNIHEEYIPQIDSQ